MNFPKLTLKLTPRGCEIEAPEHGLTIVLGAPRKPLAPVVVETEGTELPSAQPMPLRSCRSNVLPFARRSA